MPERRSASEPAEAFITAKVRFVPKGDHASLYRRMVKNHAQIHIRYTPVENEKRTWF
jgi:hypothetical protein